MGVALKDIFCLLFVLMFDLVLEAHGINNYHKPVNQGSKEVTVHFLPKRSNVEEIF